MDVVTTEAAVDAITDAVAAVTMAAIMAVITEVADGVFPVEITPAAIFCGSSSFSAAAEAGEITTVDAVVETAVDVIPADAESFKGQTFPEQGTSV